MSRNVVTTVKQSTKLKKMGINGVMTADMMWIYCNTKHPYLTDLSKNLKEGILDLTRRFDALPAWSERSLMDILPVSIEGSNLTIYPQIMNGKKVWVASYNLFHTEVADDLFDVIIAMIKVCIKNNKIESKYLSNVKEENKE